MQGLCFEETVSPRRNGDVNDEILVQGELTDKSQTIKVKRWHRIVVPKVNSLQGWRTFKIYSFVTLLSVLMCPLFNWFDMSFS